jgi:hypothetical protein
MAEAAARGGDSTAHRGRPQTGAEWLEVNRQHLRVALDRIRRILHAYSVAEPKAWDSETAAGDPYAAGSPVGGAAMALDHLVSIFGLSPFERDVLLVAAGVELDSSIAALCAAAHRDPQRPFATFSLALAALPSAHWSALALGSPLRHWRMFEIAPGQSLTTSALRVDERLLHYLTGVAAPDARLVGLITPLRVRQELAETHVELVERMTAVWRRSNAHPSPLIQLRGDGVSVKRSLAAVACASVGMTLSVTQADAFPTAAQETEALGRYWEREAALSGSALLIECDDFDSVDAARVAALSRFLDRTQSTIIISLREPHRLGSRLTVGIEVPGLSSSEQRGVWRDALGATADTLNGHVDQLVAQFDLTKESIQDAALDALTRTAATPPEARAGELGRALWDACRNHARPKLEDLAQRIDSGTTWDQLVLPEAQLQILRDVAAHVRHRTTVYETWGFARAGTRGLGISALFAGTSGTGKTMAAEVIANDLRLDLYRVDLSSVVSKYIGETEKNLRRIFDAAEQGGAVLLFDEADALFGKRSDVKDSHDRYANIEVSYLLQRMECYKGLAILTTNMRSALDTAFLRRLRFVVQFPFPDATHRAEIWRRVFPARTPLDGVDAELLSSLNVSGGNIRNIALNAAFLAADEATPVRMSHLLRAARSEYAKLEKPLTDSEVDGWV